MDQAVKNLLAEQVVGMPTETVYGLAARISSEKAIREIFQLKDRPFFDPLIVHISRIEQLNDVAQNIPALALKLANHFWPGPLTLVLQKKSNIHTMITSGLETVGVRMPNHPMALALIEKVGEPLAAPSANLFGKVSPTTAQHVRDSFPKIEILDGGPCTGGIESTVIGFTEQQILIYRPGLISKSELREFLNTNGYENTNIDQVTSEASPGHVKHHYMPEVPLDILPPGTKHSAPGYRELKLPDDAKLASRLLYNALRECSVNAKGIWFSPNQNQISPGWTALWDRLLKAATTAHYRPNL